MRRAGRQQQCGQAPLRADTPGNPDHTGHVDECAHAAARTTGSQFHGYHRTLAARLGYRRAILATAYKLLRVIHSVLRNGSGHTRIPPDPNGYPDSP